MRALDIIERKRDGYELSRDEIGFLIAGYVSGDVADYQMSAFAMAVCWRGMSDAETAALTRAMIASGQTVTLEGITRPTVDKHSTGGVGDKTTLVVAPLVASLGAAVPKLSGRGLGHTGGTLDKLESIPGFRIDLSESELVAITNAVGMAVSGPTADVVPADRRMYALRDATATVPSLPLIVSSIMSKKLAVETQALVLDVKVGEGAFFGDVRAARAFAEAAIRLGADFGRRVRCVLTAMDRPLGFAVGNSLEVAEAIATVRGDGPHDFVEVCVTIAAHMLEASGVIPDEREARALVTEQLRSGAALTTMRGWIKAQGGDADVVDTGFPAATRQIAVTAEKDGRVERVRALAVGRLAMQLGAGRERKEDAIDHAAGLVLAARVGDEVRRGDTLATLHTNRDGDDAVWVTALRDAVPLTAAAVEVASPILDLITSENGFPV